MSDAVSPNRPDEALFAHLLAGDERALRALFERYIDQLLRVATSVLRDSDAAADAVQDVFVYLWNGRDRHSVPDDVGRYLRRAVRNRALKAVARDATAIRTKQQLGEEMALDSLSYNDAVISLDTADREAALAAAIAHLQPRTREIFLLARAGLTSGEIADLLGVNPATVYNQLSRALKLLARLLAGWDV